MSKEFEIVNRWAKGEISHSQANRELVLNDLNTLVIVCAGGCGKTTEHISPAEFWDGEVKESDDPDCLVPTWTCKECRIKKMKNKIKDLESE